MKIAFFAHKWYYIDAFEPVIEKLKELGFDFDVLIIYPRNDSYVKYKAKYGAKLIEPLYQNKLANFFYNPYLLPIPFIKPYIAYILKAWFFKRALEILFHKRGYKTLITSEDREIISCIALSAAKSQGMRTIIYPIETILFVEDLIANRIAESERDSFKKKFLSLIAKKIYPKNTIYFQGKIVHHTPPRQILQLFLFNVFPKNLWLRGANKNIDIVTVGSEIQKSLDCSHGASPDKIHVTGFPPHDKINQVINISARKREEIQKILRLPPKKIFLIFGTHYISPTFISKDDCERFDRELNEIIKVLVSVLGSEYTFVFKVHPQKNLEEQKQDIEKNIRDRIVFIKDEYDAYTLIALCDATLNFMSSSTIATFATDIPLFCYDLIRKTAIAQSWLKRYHSIILIKTPTELKNALLAMQSDQIFSKRLKEKRLDDQNLYGRFDGKNTERFLRLLFSLEQ